MNFIQKMFLNFAAKWAKNKIEEVDKMNGSKQWWQSKTNLAGIVSAILSVYQLATVLAPTFGITLPPIPEWLITTLGTILGGVVIYGRNTATKTIG